MVSSIDIDVQDHEGAVETFGRGLGDALLF